jgi:predicted dehydrogenase
MHIAVIGSGHWGPNHIRNFSSLPGVQVVAAADLDEQRLAAVARTYPTLRTVRDYQELLADRQIDAVVIATPTWTHYQITKEALLAGKDVLCEKPLAIHSAQCRELAERAAAKSRVLMVGHVFLFNPGIRKLHDLVEEGKTGRIYYAHATRTNLGPIREDINASWDLACHDVSIFNYLFGSAPIEVSATGGRFLQRDIEDVAFLSLFYPEGLLANIHVSWMDPKKVRQITVVGDKTMLVWNDLDPEGPIRIYDKGVIQEPYYETFGEFQLLLRDGEISIPKVRMTEPLHLEAEHFAACVRERKNPLCDVGSALDVVRTLEAIDASLAARGQSVKVA